MDNRNQLITNFTEFSYSLTNSYGRSYFTDEVTRILYEEIYVVYIAQFEKEKLFEYALFDNYEFILKSRNIQEDDILTLVSIRHFDIYIEYLLTFDFKILKSNLKNVDFKDSIDLKKKIFEGEEIFFYKHEVLSTKNIFEIQKSSLNFENRDKIIGNYVYKNSKYYFKPNNMFVYIVNEDVLFGNYYFIDNFIQLYFDNAEEYELPEKLYYEVDYFENGLVLRNENYGHSYRLEKI